MSGDVSKVVAFLQEHAKYVDVRDKPMVFRAAELLAKLGAVTKDAERYRWLRISADISWNGWVTHSMLMATDYEREQLDAAIDAAALTDQGRAGEGS